jgi:nucleoside phosphorylase
MEMSAVFALCKYLTIPAVGLFVVSDTHDLTEKTDWVWSKKLFEENFDKAFTSLMQLTTHF